MGRPLAFYGPTQGIVQPGGLVSFRNKGAVNPIFNDPDITLGYDFTKGTLAPVNGLGPTWDFTRTSVATFYDAAGNRQTALNNEPRFDHDRTTGAALGLQTEGPRTNEFLNSDVPVTQDVTTTAKDYTVSVYGTGSVTLTGTATGVATDGAPLTVTAGAGTLTLTVAGGPDEVQLEAGSFPSSFIKTGGASATRVIDNTLSADVSWFNEAAYTIFIQLSKPFLTSVNAYMLNVQSTGADRVLMSSTGANATRVQTSATAGDGGNIVGAAVVPNAVMKLVIAHAVDDLQFFQDGGNEGADITADIQTIPATNMYLSNVQQDPWFGHTQLIAGYDVRKDNTFLGDITT